MGVYVHGDAYVRMPHQVLQCLQVHPVSGLVAVIGEAADVRGDVRYLHPEGLVLLSKENLKGI